jgi:hypothetical protein
MNERNEWEPDLFGCRGSLPQYVDVIGVCACGHRAIIPRDLPNVNRWTYLAYVRNRLKCERCGVKGARKLLVRKMPR